METCYLTAGVGFSVLKDQSQVFNVVGLKEAVNLDLAGETEEQEKTHGWNWNPTYELC